MITKQTHCPVVWKCLALNETITVEPFAVYNIQHGWLCKCGKWIKNSDRTHDVQLWGLRDGYKET